MIVPSINVVLLNCVSYIYKLFLILLEILLTYSGLFPPSIDYTDPIEFDWTFMKFYWNSVLFWTLPSKLFSENKLFIDYWIRRRLLEVTADLLLVIVCIN